MTIDETEQQMPIDVTAQKEHFRQITESSIDELRKRIGLKIQDTVEPWVNEATTDAIRHFAHGIGDDNPLWTDEEYAATSRYNTIIAPPTFLYATDRVISGYCGGLPGVHAMFAGTNWHWILPIKAGTRIRTEVYLKDLVEHDTRFAGRAIQQIYHGDFFSDKGEKLAECDSWVFRTERETAREYGEKYRDLPKKRIYSKDEIEKIADQYAQEIIRGKKPRYWEDVKVGEEIPTILKGPMTITGFIAFVQGWGGLYIRAHKLAFKQFNKHSGVAIPNSFGIPDVPERVHWEEELARAVGVPDAYDYGPERVSWMAHIMTNWIGDDGWLEKLDAKIIRHNPIGDTLYISGRVTNKSKQGNKGYVECEVVAINQDGERSCEATARVILPTKEK